MTDKDYAELKRLQELDEAFSTLDEWASDNDLTPEQEAEVLKVCYEIRDHLLDLKEDEDGNVHPHFGLISCIGVRACQVIEELEW